MNFDECQTMYKVMRNHLKKIDDELFNMSSRKRRSKKDSYSFPFTKPSEQSKQRRINRDMVNELDDALEILDYKCGYQALTSSTRKMLGNIYNDYGEML